MGGDRYQAIVVGAGPAGGAAALTLAQNNLSVLLLERGKYPGSKNMYGGTYYALPMAQIIPAFWEKGAPIERNVVTEELWLMDKDSAVKAGFTGLRFAKPPYSKFTAVRPKMDHWLADQAVQAGATLRCEALAIDLLWDKTGLLTRKVDGVKLDTGEEIRSDVVILAEGATAFLAQKAGLRKPLMAHHFTHYVKEIYGLPCRTIEERFHLEKDEGAAIGMIGFPAAGAVGKGGIWTYKECICISVGAYLSEMVTKGLSPYHLITRLKEHPMIQRLLDGAELLEYKAHLIPKGGYEQMPTLYDHGILVCGDAAQMISGRRGTDLAMLTGKMAGEATAVAHAKGDFSKETLKTYQNKVSQSFFLEDMRGGKSSRIYYEHHADSDYLISTLVNQLAYKFFDVELKSQKEIKEDLKQAILQFQPIQKNLSDFYQALLHWRAF